MGKKLHITTVLIGLSLPVGISYSAGMMMDHSMQRHHSSMRKGGIPEPYNGMNNPLTTSEDVIKNGRELFQTHCAVCHGKAGKGDGMAAQGLNPLPANLTRTMQIPMLSRDNYLMWTISDGGVKFTTAMPPFKAVINEEDRWKIVHFLRTL